MCSTLPPHLFSFYLRTYREYEFENQFDDDADDFEKIVENKLRPRTGRRVGDRGRKQQKKVTFSSDYDDFLRDSDRC